MRLSLLNLTNVSNFKVLKVVYDGAPKKNEIQFTWKVKMPMLTGPEESLIWDWNLNETINQTQQLDPREDQVRRNMTLSLRTQKRYENECLYRQF